MLTKLYNQIIPLSLDYLRAGDLLLMYVPQLAQKYDNFYRLVEHTIPLFYGREN